MHLFPRIMVGTLLPLALLGGEAGAQVSSRSGEPMKVDAAMAQKLLGWMTADLRSLKAAEEAYFKEHGQYGDQLGAPGDTARVTSSPSQGVTVTLTYATRTAWTARAVHDWLPGRSCIIAVGAIPPSRALKTTGSGKAATPAGAVVCDRP